MPRTFKLTFTMQKDLVTCDDLVCFLSDLAEDIKLAFNREEIPVLYRTTLPTGYALLKRTKDDTHG